MEVLNIIYWIKVILGLLSALICIVLGVNNIYYAIITVILVFYISDKILKIRFRDSIDKKMNITRTGIGIYFISWIFFWILIYTMTYFPS